MGCLKKVDILTDIAVRSGVIASNEIGNVTIEDAREEEIFVKGAKPVTFQEHINKLRDFYGGSFNE